MGALSETGSLMTASSTAESTTKALQRPIGLVRQRRLNRRPMGLRGGVSWAELAHRTSLARTLRNRDRIVERTSTLGSGGTAMPFYQRGDVRVRYEEMGSGMPER
jgi:hypothetical protein